MVNGILYSLLRFLLFIVYFAVSLSWIKGSYTSTVSGSYTSTLNSGSGR